VVSPFVFLIMQSDNNYTTGILLPPWKCFVRRKWKESLCLLQIVISSKKNHTPMDMVSLNLFAQWGKDALLISVLFGIVQGLLKGILTG